jgi:AGZA family xanthine/uracil permease-like MFS transporter
MAEKKKVTYVVDDEDEEEAPRKPKGTPSGVSVLLNKFFHHLDRGTSLHSEINTGIFVFLLSICMIIVNVQILGSALNGAYSIGTSPNDPTNVQVALNYTTLYVGSILIAFIGSLLMGFVARLPFVQIANLGLASSMISLVGTSAGLTYYNLLFINFLASILYVVISAVPVIRDFVLRAIPKGIRKALPAAMGLLLFVTCLSLSGLVKISTVNGFASFGLNDISSFTLLQKEAFIGALVGVVLYVILKAMKIRKSLFYAFLCATLVYIVSNLIAAGVNVEADTSNVNSFFNFGRVWVLAGSQSSPVTPYGDSYLTYFPKAFANLFHSLPNVFTKGCDFSSCKGNAFVLIVGGILNCLFLAFADFDSTVLGGANEINADIKDEKNRLDPEKGKETLKARIVNAGMNVVAPFFGQGQVTLSKTSLAGTIDSGKSGIVPAVSSIGYLISLFILAFPALLATSVYPVTSMSQWNYFAYGNGGFIYLFQGLTYAIADVVVALAGISLLKTLGDVEWKDPLIAVPAIVTIVCSFVFYSLAIGVLLAALVYAVLKFLNVRQDRTTKLFAGFRQNFVANLKTITVPEAVFSGISLIALIFIALV